jgi:hypothetical protein
MFVIGTAIRAGTINQAEGENRGGKTAADGPSRARTPAFHHHL